MAGETVDDQLSKKAQEKVEQCKTLFEKLQIHALLSDNNLEPLLPCITLFSKGSEIPVRRLVAIWVAEGLVHQNPGGKDTLESIAQRYLSKLIDLNIIQPLKKNVNGKVRTYCLPDPLHGELTTFPNQPPRGTRRCVLSTSSDRQRLEVACHNNGHISNESCSVLDDSANFVSLISLDTREGDKPGNDIDNFLQKRIADGSFEGLKVLDLERVFRPRLPKAIAKLVELRYLGLRWTYLEEIPPTIGSLLNLQTLDLKHTYIRILPNTVGKLQNLRHLYLNQTCRAKFVQQSKTESLFNLQTLWGVFLDGKSPLEGLFYGLNSLRKLELSLHLSSAQQEVLAERIAKLINLESLRLRSVSVMSEPRDLYLGNFSELKGLSNISLFGRLHNALSSSYFPDSLSELTLSASGLEYDPMQILRKLPELRSLCLFSDSFAGEHMICSSGWFSKLLVLKIWKLGNLEDWTIEEKAMENLKELEIRSCPKLKVPDGLRHLKTLRQLKLRNMPEKFSGECSLFVPLSIIETKQDKPRDE